MTDRDRAGEKWARVDRAREREARALAHEREARRKAESEPDPELARMHRVEAETHARAARVQREAIVFQAQHAEEYDG